MRHVVLAALAFATTAVGDEPAVPAEELFPLAVGNSWTYRVGGQDDRFVVRAAKQEMVGSQTCFLLEARLKDKVVATEHVAFTKDGLCRLKAEQAEIVPPMCILRVPAPKRGWTQRYAINGRDAVGSFGTRTEDVTVLDKKYKATVVMGWTSEGRGPPRTTVWYAAGVGPVKQTVDEGKNRILVLELEKFEKAK